MQIKRDVGLDFIKIIACFLVVALHTIKPSFSVNNFAIVAIAVTAIPFFLMVNGYLMFQKETLTYDYVGKKIIRILAVCFSWEALHSVAYYLYYHEVRNFIKSFLLDFLQQGLFFHFWFMGTLIILYLILPFLYRLYDRNSVIYICILAGLGIICFSVNLIMTFTKNQFILEIPQSLRLWNWLLYYMLGGLMAKKKSQINGILYKYSRITKMIIFVVAIVLLIFWQWLIGNIIIKHYVLETFYGSIPIIVSTMILFLCLSGLNYKHGKVITYLSGLSMGIYIFHPFVLAVFQKFIPTFISGNAGMNLLFWFVTVITCGAVTAVIKRIPVIKELIKL